MHWGDFGLGMGFVSIFMILLWVIVILGIVFLVKYIAGGSKTKIEEESTLEILKKRYAEGEITKEEFERMKGDLSKD